MSGKSNAANRKPRKKYPVSDDEDDISIEDEPIKKPKDKSKTKPKVKPRKVKDAPSEGADIIRRLLSSLDIIVLEEVSVPQCKYKKPLRFDFLLQGDENHAVIEFDGEQHFKFISSWHKTEENFQVHKQKDIIKNRFLRERKIPILRIAYTEQKHLAKHITDFITALRKGYKNSKFIPSDMYPDPYGESDTTCTLQ